MVQPNCKLEGTGYDPPYSLQSSLSWIPLHPVTYICVCSGAPAQLIIENCWCRKTLRQSPCCTFHWPIPTLQVSLAIFLSQYYNVLSHLEFSFALVCCAFCNGLNLMCFSQFQFCIGLLCTSVFYNCIGLLCASVLYCFVFFYRVYITTH